MKKALVVGLHEESNSFNPLIEEYSLFENYGVYDGDEVVKEGAKSGVTIKGMVRALKENGVTPIGGLTLRADSGGPLSDSVVERFLTAFENAYNENRDIDGVLACMHGATVSDKSFDVCGDIFEKMRQIVGDSVIISASFDLHANITDKIMKNCDYISGYQTYPHLDLENTGYRAGLRMAERLSGKRYYTAKVDIPQIAPAHAYTTGTGNLKVLMDEAEDLRRKGIIVDYNIFQVQPWLDTPELNSTVVICAKDKETAKRVAEDLAKKEFALRKELLGKPLLTIDEVIDIALNNETGKPVVLADSSDSPNAGACGDSPAVLEKALPYKDRLKVAVGLNDKRAVDKAFEIGVGATAEFELGGTIAPEISKTIKVTATVKSLHDGKFQKFGPQERGIAVNLGKTAVLTAGGIHIHVSYRTIQGDIAFYRAFGTEPSLCDLVAVKVCTSFRAGYKDIASHMINADTPGVSACNLLSLPYKRRPTPLYPFEEISEKDISQAKIFR